MRYLAAAALLPALLVTSNAHAGRVSLQGLPADAVLVDRTASTDTYRSQGYDITYTVDRQYGALRGWAPGIGVQWYVDADGIAQGAWLAIARTDGAAFDLDTLSLAPFTSTGGAGLDFEVVPSLAGQNGAPRFFTGTGGAGQVFRFDTLGAPSVQNPYSQSTRSLAGYDRYQIGFTFDFGLIEATLVDATSAVPEPSGPALLLLGLGVGALRGRRQQGVARRG